VRGVLNVTDGIDGRGRGQEKESGKKKGRGDLLQGRMKFTIVVKMRDAKPRPET
jgi:hypothetical protein